MSERNWTLMINAPFDFNSIIDHHAFFSSNSKRRISRVKYCPFVNSKCSAVILLIMDFTNWILVYSTLFLECAKNERLRGQYCSTKSNNRRLVALYESKSDKLRKLNPTVRWTFLKYSTCFRCASYLYPLLLWRKKWPANVYLFHFVISLLWAASVGMFQSNLDSWFTAKLWHWLTVILSREETKLVLSPSSFHYFCDPTSEFGVQ